MIHWNKLRSGLLYSGALLSALLPSLPGQAGELEARVLNSKGELVAQAVVYARPLAASVEAGDSRDAVIEQVDKEFIPALTVVYRGARISFPNRDSVRHHVYSFSKTNAFEIPLYRRALWLNALNPEENFGIWTYSPSQSRARPGSDTGL